MKTIRGTKKSRTPKPIIVIFCEGKKTEKSYFECLFKSTTNKDNFTCHVCQPTNHSPRGIVEAACEEKESLRASKIPERDMNLWAVFDRNGHNKIPEAFDIATKHNIHVAFSNICFEFWVLLHYKQTRRSFTSCDELVSYIRANWDSKYEKDDNCYERLKDDINTAICNGRWLLKQVELEISRGKRFDQINPYTDVHKLVEFLLNPNRASI